jgi:PKD repeat protein
MKRRRLLVVTAGATVGLAGCLGGDGDNSDDGSDDSGPGPGPDNGTSDNGDDDNGGADLEPRLDWEPETPIVGEEVTFDGSGSVGDVAEYRWDFTGDGSFDTTGETVTHTFEESGEVTVTLQVENDAGTAAQAEATLSVDPGLAAALEITPSDPFATEEITFDASPSTGDIALFLWEFSDQEGNVTGETVTRTFEEPGNVTVSLIVETEQRERDTTNTDVQIADFEPGVAALEVSPENPEPEEQVTFDASSSEGDIRAYRWDFDGDDETDQTTTAPTVTHTYDQANNYTVGLRLDGPGDTTPAFRELTVGTPIEAALDWSPENPDPGTEVTLDGSDSVSRAGNITAYTWLLPEETRTTTDPTTTYVVQDSPEVVSLEVEDDQGNVATVSETIGEEMSNDIPESITLTPSDPVAGEEVTFEVEETDEVDVVEFRWDFTGDGEFDTTTESFVATYTFDESGEFVITIEAELDSGDVVSEEFSLSVSD